MNNIIKNSSRLFIGEDIPTEYLSDVYVKDVKRPYAVALPTKKSEVVEIVKYANEHNKVIIARGASTGVAGSQIPIIGGEIIIDFSKMTKIINFDHETLTLTVEPGVLLQDIQKAVEGFGYFYPPDPGSKHSTIGGNIATNAGGMRAVKYGTTRDYVKAVEVVLPNGEVTILGSLNVKHSSGYDLTDLFVGSEGTLGLITEVKLKVIPMPQYSKSLILAFNDVVEATDIVLDILKNGYEPTALEMFEKDTIEYSEKLLNLKFQSQVGHAYILLTIDGNDEEAINNKFKKLEEQYKDQVLEIVFLNDEEEEIAWKLRDHILYALMELSVFEMLDEVVPINKFGEMIRYTKSLQEKHGIKVFNFGHAGDGNVHTILMKENYSDEEWAVKRKALLNDLYDEVYRLGGLASAEHGIGVMKKEYFLKLTDPIKVNLMKVIKNAIDPKNLFNPHKIF
ncbi:MAG: FAD-binding oxidoreductase [Bacilli bacterium]|nr:FAD-binding oxidoreductase [Bacilli bacterium]